MFQQSPSSFKSKDSGCNNLRRVLLLSALISSALIASGRAEAIGSATRQAQQTTVAQSAQEVTSLELGKTIARQLSGGQKHSYQFMLTAGQYASIIVKQRGIDVLVKVSGTDGKLIAYLDSDVRSEGQEKVELVAETTGDYKISVENKLTGPPARHYEIRLEELRPATQKDRSLKEARRLNTEAFTLYWDRTDIDKAQLLAERSLRIFENAEGPEHPDVANALTTLALIHGLKRELEIAEPMLQRALTIREKAFGPEHLAVADSLSELGRFWWQRGFYARAEALTQEVLAIREKALGPEHLLVSGTLNGLANIQVSIGNYAAAKPLYHRALEIAEKLLGPEDIRVAKLLEELAGVYAREGYFAMAESLYQHALAICERRYGPESEWASNTLTLLADSYMKSGDYTRAGSLYQRSLEIREKILQPGHHAIGHSLYRLGSFSFKTGDDAQAEIFYLRAVAIWEKGKFFGRDYPNIDTGGELFSS